MELFKITISTGKKIVLYAVFFVKDFLQSIFLGGWDPRDTKFQVLKHGSAIKDTKEGYHLPLMKQIQRILMILSTDVFIDVLLVTKFRRY